MSPDLASNGGSHRSIDNPNSVWRVGLPVQSRGSLVGRNTGESRECKPVSMMGSAAAAPYPQRVGFGNGECGLINVGTVMPTRGGRTVRLQREYTEGSSFQGYLIMSPMSPSPGLERLRKRHKITILPRSSRVRAICWLPKGHGVNFHDVIE